MRSKTDHSGRNNISLPYLLSRTVQASVAYWRRARWYSRIVSISNAALCVLAGLNVILIGRSELSPRDVGIAICLTGGVATMLARTRRLCVREVAKYRSRGHQADNLRAEVESIYVNGPLAGRETDFERCIERILELCDEIPERRFAIAAPPRSANTIFDLQVGRQRSKS